LEFTVRTFSYGTNGIDSTVTIEVTPYNPIAIAPGSTYTFDQNSLGKNNKKEYIEVTVVDPKTNSPISGDIFKNTTLEPVYASENGVAWIVDKNTGKDGVWRLFPQAIDKKGDIKIGTWVVKLKATYDDKTDFTKAKAITVDGSVTIEVNSYAAIAIQPPQPLSANQSSLGKNNTTMFAEITVIDPVTNLPISGDVFLNTELKTVNESENGITWTVDKNTGKDGVWKLIPQATDKKSAIKTGTWLVGLKATYDDGADYTGANAITVTGSLEMDISETPPKSVTLHFEDPAGSFETSRFKLTNHAPIRVTVKYKGSPISGTAWTEAQDDSLIITPDDPKLQFRIEKSTDEGVWNVYLEPTNGKGYYTPPVKSFFEMISAIFRQGGTNYPLDAEVGFMDSVNEDYYEGKGTHSINIKVDILSILWEIWLDYWIPIVSAIVTAGYLFKPKFSALALLEFRHYGIKFESPNRKKIKPEPEQIRIGIGSLLTFLLPFVAQRASLKCDNAYCDCPYYSDLKIKGVNRLFPTRIRFAIRQKITKEELKDMKIETFGGRDPETFPLKKENNVFALAGFRIEGESRGQRGNGVVEVFRN